MPSNATDKVIAASLAYPIVRQRRRDLRERVEDKRHRTIWIAPPTGTQARERYDALYDREKDLLAIITETEL